MLEVDEDSRLGREILAEGVRYGARDVPDEDMAATFYELGCGLLADAGIHQYEISNFARSGQESRHNVKYWLRRPYVGFGLDAHSMLATADGAVRFQNTDDLDAYMALDQGPLQQLQQSAGRIQPDSIDEEAAFEESLFLGLRMNEGVDLQMLNAELLQRIVSSMREASEAGLLTFEGNRVQLTARGRMASNEVFSRLLIPAMA
jgi:oxygen-independent coproporphyrinogen-3 oxidase